MAAGLTLGVVNGYNSGWWRLLRGHPAADDYFLPMVEKGTRSGTPVVLHGEADPNLSRVGAPVAVPGL